MSRGSVGMSGKLILRVTTLAQRQEEARRRVRRWHVRNWIKYRWRELPFYLFLFVLPLVKRFVPALTVVHSKVYLRITRSTGEVEDYGCVGRHLVTNAGKAYIAACMNAVMGAEPELLRFHGFGNGAVAAAAGDVALGAEYGAQYAVNNTRPTGSQANSGNTYTTIAAFAPDAAVTTTEWGLFSQAAVPGGTMLDRQVYAGQPLNGVGDQLTSTYVLTFA